MQGQIIGSRINNSRELRARERLTVEHRAGAPIQLSWPPFKRAVLAEGKLDFLDSGSGDRF